MKISSKLYCKDLWISIVTVILIISAMAPLIAEAEINSTGTYFWISPTTNIHQTVGNNFTITINIQNAPPTSAWDLNLTFNNITLSVVGASEGNWLSSAGKTIFLYTPFSTANKHGSIGIGDTLNVSSSANGNGILCTVKFKVLASGTSVLDLLDGTTALLSPSLVSTVYPNNDGFYAGTAVHDIGITSVVANVSSVSQGAFVGLTVTVNNQGNYTESGNVTVTAVPIDTRESTVTIGTKTFASLASGSSTILPTFTWNTAGVAGQVYNIVSTATLTSATDIDLHNNVFIGPIVRVISPHDIKVSGVTILTPLVHKNKIASVNVTVYNEGNNPENVSATVLGTLPGPVTSSLTSIAFTNLAIGASSTVTASWNTSSDATGPYTITVNATLPAGEHETDLADNTMTASGTLSVIIDDVGITGISVAPYGRWINVTVKNFGTVPAYCTVYVWAVWINETSSFNMSWTIPTVKAPTAHALLIGEIENVYLLNNTSETFFSLDPYGSAPFGVPTVHTAKANQFDFTLWPPAAPYNGTPLTSGTHYAIYAVAVKLYDVDDNLANNVFKAPLTMEARLAGDVDGAGYVGARALGEVLAAYNAYWGSPLYRQQCDFNNAGNVGAFDLTKCLSNYNVYY